MSMKQQTALTELIDKIEREILEDDGDPFYNGLKAVLEEAQSFLPKEKQQIIEAWVNGGSTMGAKNAEQYFKEVYEKD